MQRKSFKMFFENDGSPVSELIDSIEHDVDYYLRRHLMIRPDIVNPAIQQIMSMLINKSSLPMVNQIIIDAKEQNDAENEREANAPMPSYMNYVTPKDDRGLWGSINSKKQI